MHKLALLVTVSAIAASTPASAASRIGSGLKLGLGVGLGSPTSLNLKYFLDGKTAFDVGLIVSRHYGGVGVHGDVIFHLKDLASAGGPADIPFYVGVGLEVGTWSTGSSYYWDPWGRRIYYSRQGANFALRVPIGIALWLRAAPLELYVELGPEVWILSPVIDGFATLGVRYYF